MEIYRQKHIPMERSKKIRKQIVSYKRTSSLDEKALDKKEKSFKKLLKTEPSRPTFHDRLPAG